MEVISNVEPEATQEPAKTDNIVFLKNFIGYDNKKEASTSENPTFFPEYSEEYLSPVCNWE